MTLAARIALRRDATPSRLMAPIASGKSMATHQPQATIIARQRANALAMTRAAKAAPRSNVENSLTRAPIAIGWRTAPNRMKVTAPSNLPLLSESALATTLVAKVAPRQDASSSLSRVPIAHGMWTVKHRTRLALKSPSPPWVNVPAMILVAKEAAKQNAENLVPRGLIASGSLSLILLGKPVPLGSQESVLAMIPGVVEADMQLVTVS